jgi:hypothetical protein
MDEKQAPQTKTGKRLHGEGDLVGDWPTLADIIAIEREAAAMERERLRRRTIETDNDNATWCESPAGEAATGELCFRCKGILRYLLADPED